MKTDWIAVRSPGNIVHWLVGTESEVLQKVNQMNESDDTGSTELLSGPFTHEEAREEFDRLNG